MARYENAFYRLSELMTLLMSGGYEDGKDGLSVEKISSLTSIPLSVLQSDMVCLFSDRTVRNALIVGDNSETDSDTKQEELKDEWLRSLKLKERKAFTKTISIDSDILFGGDKGESVFVNLTPFEKNVFAKTVKLSHSYNAVWIKEPVFKKGSEDIRVLGPIQIAIEQNHPISFRYDSPDGEMLCSGFSARCIYEVLESGTLYCVGVSDDDRLLFYRMDRISDLRVHEDEENPPLKDGALDKLDYVWGAEVSEKTVHVKIKIFKETKNIFEKIKTETNARKYGRLYDDPDDENVAYYEDDVCGLNSFKKWLRGYGASVLVLEPLSLAEDMYRSALRRLENYKKIKER